MKKIAVLLVCFAVFSTGQPLAVFVDLGEQKIHFVLVKLFGG